MEENLKTKIIRGIWQLYAAIVVILTVIGTIVEYKTSQNIAFPIASLLFTTLYLVGLYGYVYNEVIFNRKLWRICFWFNIFGLSAKSLSYFLRPTNELLIDLIATIVFIGPLIIALYKYSHKNNILWPIAKYSEKALTIKNLLSTNSLLSASVTTEQQDGDVKTEVQIQKNNSMYVVKITKNKNGKEEKFNNEFTLLEELIKFIEGNTPIRTGDFA